MYVKSAKYTMRGIWFLQLITQVIAVHSPRQETIGSLIMQNSGQFSNWPTERSSDRAKAKAAYNSLRSLIIKNHPASMLKTNNPFTQAQINTINDLHKKYSEIPTCSTSSESTHYRDFLGKHYDIALNLLNSLISETGVYTLSNSDFTHITNAELKISEEKEVTMEVMSAFNSCLETLVSRATLKSSQLLDLVETSICELTAQTRHDKDILEAQITTDRDKLASHTINNTAQLQKQIKDLDRQFCKQVKDLDYEFYKQARKLRSQLDTQIKELKSQLAKEIRELQSKFSTEIRKINY